ncbi:MAG: L,D-transpeptidase family protein [Gammaproteobacteria bacterium]
MISVSSRKVRLPGQILVGILVLCFSLGYLQTFAQAAPATALAVPESTLLAPRATEAFYLDRQPGPAWQDDDLFDQLLTALEGLRDHGLDPEHYHLATLRDLRNDRARRDRYATDAWFSAAAHMLYGKLDPVTVEPDWTAGSREADLNDSLLQALAAGEIAASLTQFAPRQPQYTSLVEHYRQLRQRELEPINTVPAGPTLRSGDYDDRVTVLQQHLDRLGTLDEDYQPGLMDAATVEAVKIFQAQNDLEPDGLVGPATLSALNFGPQQKLDKLRVNLERWRWLPEELGQRHIRVNIAGFTVTTWENGSLLRTHLAVVGKDYRKTPVFSDQIEYLIFNPWWEVPYSIARIDKLPLFRQEPELIRELGFEVLDRNGKALEPDTIDWNSVSQANFPYRLRQAPGEENALGQVKIMFPNAHNVYLHDTPARGLFEQRQRAFSSGCIRTQFPLELSRWLLEGNPGWDRERIDSVVASGQETRVNLTTRVPIHILYHTTVSEPGGGVLFLDDIYQRDAAVLNGLLTPHH